MSASVVPLVVPLYQAPSDADLAKQSQSLEVLQSRVIINHVCTLEVALFRVRVITDSPSKAFRMNPLRSAPLQISDFANIYVYVKDIPGIY